MKKTFFCALLLFVSPLLSAQTVASSEYAARRNELARAIGPNGVFIALSPEPVTRNGSVEWPFRQDDDLKYLTGIDERDTALVVLPAESEWRDVIFARPFDASAELWTGPIPTKEEVQSRSGVAKVELYDQFRDFLAALFGGKAWGPSTVYRAFRPATFLNFRRIQREGQATVWLLLGDRAATATPVKELLTRLRTDYPELQFRDATPLLLHMREVKSSAELALLQRAIDITDEAHRAAMKRARTATSENQLQATIEFTYRDRGADGWGFPSIVAAGRNATVLHYEINESPIDRNGLVLIDIGAEFDGYTADITRTIPADGTFTPEQRAIHDAVLRAQTESIKLMRPGANYDQINLRAEQVLGEDLLKLGLITKNEMDQVRMYFRHGVGHPIGLQVHDVYDRSRPFEAGMVVTNEPGIYVRRNDVVASAFYKKLTDEERKKVDAALARYEGIGVRIEDDLLITEGEPKLLSKSPRSTSEIEAFMRER
jgi:Xaa-Pro aminopeptidase